MEEKAEYRYRASEKELRDRIDAQQAEIAALVAQVEELKERIEDMQMDSAK